MQYQVDWVWGGNGMVKKIIFAAVIVSPIIAVHAGFFPSKDIQKLIEKVEILNDKCRGGSGDDPKTMKACEDRDNLILKIESKGYCWGSMNKNVSTNLYTWIPCKKDVTRK